MLVLNVFRTHMAKVGQLVFAALLILCCPAKAQQLTFTSPIQLTDNEANQGSPTLVYRSPTTYMYFVNHSNQISVDTNFSQVPTAVQVDGVTVNSNQLTDVGATVLNGNILLSYIPNGSNSVAIASSTDGVHFGTASRATNANLGLPSTGSTFDYAFVPSLAAAGSIVYCAAVGTDSSGKNLVYISWSTDGLHYSPLQVQGVPVSTYGTVSRPALVYNTAASTWYVAFTTAPAGQLQTAQAVIGPASSNGGLVPVGTPRWGNSHRSCGTNCYNISGLSMVNWPAGGPLHVFGQSTFSSQELMYASSSSGWSTTYTIPKSGSGAIQMRWTPSVIGLSYLYLAYQDDTNTNISYQHSQ